MRIRNPATEQIRHVKIWVAFEELFCLLSEKVSPFYLKFLWIFDKLLIPDLGGQLITYTTESGSTTPVPNTQMVSKKQLTGGGGGGGVLYLMANCVGTTTPTQTHTLKTDTIT